MAVPHQMRQLWETTPIRQWCSSHPGHIGLTSPPPKLERERHQVQPENMQDHQTIPTQGLEHRRRNRIPPRNQQQMMTIEQLGQIWMQHPDRQTQ